ncbi:MAG: DNA repair protein RecN [Caldimicrobium thiodismutans]|jgi:DNA repair protein RecN (Recombination protein N)
MLLELKIKNFVLIEEASFSLDEGLTVITGETGAGKSLLVKALKVLLGEKGEAGYIKGGSEWAEVEALIYGGKALSEKLKGLGYPPEEEIHIKRIITKQRTKAFLNGSPITLAELAKVTKDLISLTSQHEYYIFLNRENQLNFLDEILEVKSLVKRYQEKFYQYRDLKKELLELENKISEATLRKDFLLYQISEIEELNPDPEEEAELLKKRERLRHLQLIKDLLYSLSSELDEIDLHLSKALGFLQKLSRFETSLTEKERTLQEFYYELKELQRDLSGLSAELPEDESSLEEIEFRLSRYEKLKKKYGKDAQGLKELKEELKKELSLIETGEEKLEKLLREKERLERELLEMALEIRRFRKEGIQKLKDLVKKELKDLGMNWVEFEINLMEKEPKAEKLTIYGLDEVEFLFSPNPGQPLRPLEKIASGGELSRIFLAFKTLLKEKKDFGTLIFDEVDTGIGGQTAHKVGEKLKELSENFQVICITHLPQIARLADHHFVVEKRLKENETVTFFKKVEGEERLREMARMLGDINNLELAKKFLTASYG